MNLNWMNWNWMNWTNRITSPVSIASKNRPLASLFCWVMGLALIINGCAVAMADKPNGVSPTLKGGVADLVIDPSTFKPSTFEPSSPDSLDNEADFIATLERLKAPRKLPHSKKMTLQQAIASAFIHNDALKVSRQTIEETEAKQDGVERKRILFFFKYFDAAYLEGSAESEVKATEQSVRAVEQETLNTTLAMYANAIEASLGENVAYWQLKQALMQRKVGEHQFNAGQVTSFVLNGSTQKLYTQYHLLLNARALRIESAYALALQVFGSSKNPVIPKEIMEVTPLNDATDDATVLMKTLPDMKSPWLAEKKQSVLFKHALATRPDYQELLYHHESVDKLRTASKLSFDGPQTRLIEANLESLRLRLKQLERAIELEVARNIRDLKNKTQQLMVADQQMALATKGLRQAKVSHRAGFSSDKDVLDAQFVFEAARAQQGKVILNTVQAKAAVLRSLGELTPSVFGIE